MPDMHPEQVAARVAAIIRSHPGSWRQDVWLRTGQPTTGAMLAEVDGAGECGTVACIAGWAAIVALPAGAEPRQQDPWMWRAIAIPDGEDRLIEYVAAEVLDLDWREAGWLFSEERTRDDVLWALDSIAAGLRFGVTLDLEDD